MNPDWELLAPKYVNDFFAAWYSSYGVAIFTTILVVLLLVWVGLIWLIKEIEKAPPESKLQPCKRWRILILIHWSQKSPRNWRYWGLVLVVGIINLIYVMFHWKIVESPTLLANGSLQRLNNDDFVTLVQFFYRWIALGWVLMVVSVGLVSQYLGRGYENLLKAAYKDSANFANSHKFLLILTGLIRNDTSRLINESLIFPPTKDTLNPIGITSRGHIGTLDEPSSALLTLSYSPEYGWSLERSQNDLPVKVLSDDHLLKPSDAKVLTYSHSLRWKLTNAAANRTDCYFCEIVLK